MDWGIQGRLCTNSLLQREETPDKTTAGTLYDSATTTYYCSTMILIGDLRAPFDNKVSFDSHWITLA